jgi:CDP-glycerol glycerophosphotransferase
MIFYLYDLEDYATNLRGMYFDIVKEAPGPIVYNNDELVDSIINIDNAMQKCADRVDAFYNTYVNYECANSSQKVAEILLKDRNSFYNKILRWLIRVGRKLKSHIKKSK